MCVWADSDRPCVPIQLVCARGASFIYACIWVVTRAADTRCVSDDFVG